jgi:hypothetical protein
MLSMPRQATFSAHVSCYPWNSNTPAGFRCLRELHVCVTLLKE